ncbi:hypothetical protein [Paenibacillus brasilensis]|uniref:Uncharacterized protein n=1 Tax=Paenibacillus brasilensis TaxID=128574 RepID=A0ABU0L6D1_9BACL|nr:hypothetical protein [Paenibacillus brasilensis]MDQ0496811.1 hypothetical protein [Paenibacillus brasilensis]
MASDNIAFDAVGAERPWSVRGISGKVIQADTSHRLTAASGSRFLAKP